jgi:hypothetical protein
VREHSSLVFVGPMKIWTRYKAGIWESSLLGSGLMKPG